MQILIENCQRRCSWPNKRIRTAAEIALRALGYPDAQLSILIVDDDRIAELNATYLNRTGPTNVIAFPMQQGECSGVTPNLLGDVVISADTACREADQAGMEAIERLNQLLIHGILHLIGYDHIHSEAAAAAMEQKSAQLMALIGAP
jgi:probable rRNA maturation factor